MESVAFFEKKVSLTPSDLNKVKSSSIDSLLLERSIAMMENYCSEQGFVLPGSIKLISRSMGYFEAARFTGDTNYYVKLEGKVIYPVDGVRVKGEVIRKNKMGLYVNYKQAIRIQVPRDLHIGNLEYDQVQLGDTVEVELKRSKFAIRDAYILASGIFHSVSEKKLESRPVSPIYDEKEDSSEQKSNGSLSAAEVKEQARLRAIRNDEDTAAGYKATIEDLEPDRLLQEYTTERNPALRALLRTEIEQRGLSVPDL